MTQKEALNILKTGRNVFLTGAAGSGKTFVLRQYIEHLEKLGAQVGKTASTGIAATHMQGLTIHSWSGIGIRDHLTKDEVVEIAEKPHVRSKVKTASVLVIDEISMLHHYQLDLVDKVLRQIKGRDAPFGGLQVVFCGDFFQLPPVRKSGETNSLFAYEAKIWQDMDLKICYLTEQYRQNDLRYLQVLNTIRSGRPDQEMRDILQSRVGQKSNFGPTRLYAHNRDVDSENFSELEKVTGPVHEYEMQQRGRHNLVEILKKSCLAPENLQLKVGAKVMFVKNNFDAGFVNGTLGVVTKCAFEEIEVQTLSGQKIAVERATWVIEEDGKIKAEINQFPLRLAWAITIHKSQGMSLDAAEIELSHSFEKGMGYVALSRVRSLDGLFLKGFNETALQINETVLLADQKFRETSLLHARQLEALGENKLAALHDDFAKRVAVSKKAEKKLDTVSETLALLDEGLSIKEIAQKRGLKVGTILDHIEEIKQKKPDYNLYNLQAAMSRNKFQNIYRAFRQTGLSEGGGYRLAPVKELLGSKYSYDDLRLVRLFL